MSENSSSPIPELEKGKEENNEQTTITSKVTTIPMSGRLKSSDFMRDPYRDL